MGLDMGLKRIGVALGDLDHGLSHPFCVIECKNRDRDIQAISDLVNDKQVGLIVMGLSRSANGELSATGEKARRYAKRLERRLGIPVKFVDEANTTVEADEVLHAAQVSREKRRKVVDMLAASLILKRYLEGEREQL